MIVKSRGGKRITVGPKQEFDAARPGKNNFDKVNGRPVWIYDWIKLFVYKYHRKMRVCETTTGHAIHGHYSTTRKALEAAYIALRATGKKGCLASVRQAQKEHGITPYAKERGWK